MYTGDLGQFYSLVSHWQEDATLAGADTLLGVGEEVPPEDEAAFALPEIDPNDTRPLVVVPDNRGRVRIWHALRQFGFWRDVVALCSRFTPSDYLEYLQKRCVSYIVAGGDHVDYRVALEELNARFVVRVIRVDSGGPLNGILLRTGLVDELSLLVNPALVGGTSPRSIFRAPDLSSSESVIRLRLSHLERLSNDVVWLRYDVAREAARK